MPLPIHSLPVLQNWDCHLCGQCCKEYVVPVTEEEKQRIESQGWQNLPEYQGVQLFKRRGPPWRRSWQLNHRADGSCVFLSSQGHCSIHERFGYETKPLPCRLFPFVPVPAGKQWRVGVRYACPSSVGNLGRAIDEHRSSLREFTNELARREKLDVKDGAFDLKPPCLDGRKRVAWADLLLIVDVLFKMMRDRRDPVERRLRKCLAFAGLVRQATFDKITGPRLAEFLQITATSIDTDVPRDPATLSPPSGIGKLLFRMILAMFTRKDQGPLRGVSARGRIALFRAAISFVRGKGRVPRLHGWLPETTFAQVEHTASRRDEQTEELLERYYSMKIGSLQFFGSPFYHYPLWTGLNALALTFPMIHFVARMFSDLKPVDALAKALSIVGDHFGFNKLLGGVRYRASYRILGSRGETERLIGWYAR